MVRTAAQYERSTRLVGASACQVRARRSKQHSDMSRDDLLCVECRKRPKLRDGLRCFECSRQACCGHARRLHTPRCAYWIMGTRDDPPHMCGCEALVSADA